VSADDSSILSTLKTVFGFDQFRDGQAKIISKILEGKSALAVFPTGSGKSLCYQLSALHLPGLTLVISPLIALMKDQIDFLRSCRPIGFKHRSRGNPAHGCGLT
jgi:ATP-dependent DNA helicase RecQ